MSGRRTSGRHRLPPTRWKLVVVGLVTVLIALLLAGYAHHDIGRSSTVAAGGPADPVAGGGSVVGRSGDRLTSHTIPAKTVAFTFDDGPDPTWTPRILDVLRRERVPATFFVVGSRVLADPGIVRREIADHDEIGSHTFTHANLSALSGWRTTIELTTNQLALAGSVGMTTSLLRLPYSSVPTAVTKPDRSVLERVTGRGYTVVFADRDSEDWRRPGVPAIVHNALPAGGAGAIVLLHDGGGNRAQTVAALPALIDGLKAKGYRFTTVSAALGLPATAGMRSVGIVEHLQGLALAWAIRGGTLVAAIFRWLLVALGALIVLRTLAVLAYARRHATLARRRPDNGWVPLVSVIVPAFNEAVGIAATVRSVAAANYPDVEVIVVDDGSTDGTAEIVRRLGLPNVRVISQPNAGKAVALNTGIQAARYDVIVMIDGDTVFEPDTIRRLVQPLRDDRVGAVSGNTKVGNRRRLLGRWQHVEYVVGFNLDRRMYDTLRCMPTVPGAVGAYSRAALVAVGGLSTDTMAEDTDLTISITRAGWRVVYEERAVARTEAPASIAALWRQRFRWSYGTLQAVWKHRGAATQTGSGWQLGRIGLPYLLAFQFALPLLAPVIDLYALYGVVFLDPVRVAGYWCGFLLVQLITGVYALRLDRERLRPLWSVPLQQFVYRQLMYLVVLQSIVGALSGARLRWHRPERTGITTEEPTRIAVPR